MPKQPAIPCLRDARKKKVTRSAKFLLEMDEVVPWVRLVALIGPNYLKVGAAQGGRSLMPLEIMLRIYFLQSGYALSDPWPKRASIMARLCAGLTVSRWVMTATRTS